MCHAQNSFHPFLLWEPPNPPDPNLVMIPTPRCSEMPITRVGVGLPHQFLFHRGLICQDTSRPLPAPLCQIRQARHLLLGDLSPRSLRLRDDNQVEYMMFVKEPTKKKNRFSKYIDINGDWSWSFVGFTKPPPPLDPAPGREFKAVSWVMLSQA